MQRMFVQYTRRTTRKLCKMFLLFFYKNNDNGSKTGRKQNPNKMYAKSAQNVCKCP